METTFEVVVENVRYIVFRALLDGFRPVVIELPCGGLRRCYGPLYRGKFQEKNRDVWGSPRHVEKIRSLDPHERIHKAVVLSRCTKTA